MRFDKKVALITAAASGIGRATADIIAAEGGTVVAVDTDKARLDKMLAEFQLAGGRAPATAHRQRRSFYRGRYLHNWGGYVARHRCFAPLEYRAPRH